MRPTFTVPLWGFTGVEENDRGSTEHANLGRPPCPWPGLPHSGVRHGEIQCFQWDAGLCTEETEGPRAQCPRGESTAHTMGDGAEGRDARAVCLLPWSFHALKHAFPQLPPPPFPMPALNNPPPLGHSQQTSARPPCNRTSTHFHSSSCTIQLAPKLLKSGTTTPSGRLKSSSLLPVYVPHSPHSLPLCFSDTLTRRSWSPLNCSCRPSLVETCT